MIQEINIKIGQLEKYLIPNIELQLEMIEGKSPAVLCILGDPGIGKTEILQQISKKYGYGLVIQHMAIMLLEMLTGLPKIDNQTSEVIWSKPEILNFSKLILPSINGKIILFLDDIHLCTKEVQKYLFRLLDSSNRGIHGHILPKNVAIIMASNRDTNKAGFQQIMSPVSNRIYFLSVQNNADEWIENYAIKNKVSSDIISFIDMNPHLLSSEPLESKPWASPRSWTNLSLQIEKHLQASKVSYLDTEMLLHISSGMIGEEYAKKYIEHVKLLLKWESEKILSEKKTVDISNLNKSDCYCLMISCVNELIKNMRKKNDRVQKQAVVFTDIAKEICKVAIEVVATCLKLLIMNETSLGGEEKISLNIIKSLDIKVLEKLKNYI